MTALIKLSAGTTGCEWRIRNTNFTEKCNLLGYSVSNARERGAGPAGALTEWSVHPDWLSAGTDVLMSIWLERWMFLRAMADALEGKTDGSDFGSVRLWAVRLRNNGNNHFKMQRLLLRRPCTSTDPPGKKYDGENSWEWLKASSISQRRYNQTICSATQYFSHRQGKTGVHHHAGIQICDPVSKLESVSQCFQEMECKMLN